MDNFDDHELENEIGKLLRLKKYEQPPPGYFEDFLHEFHRRQRDALLRQPLWSVLWQRLTNSLFRLNLPALTSYPAAATAVLICAAVISLRVYHSPAISSGGEIGTSTDPIVQVADPTTFVSPVTLTTSSLEPGRYRSTPFTRRGQTPRYVLDRLPVSYEPSFNF